MGPAAVAPDDRDIAPVLSPVREVTVYSRPGCHLCEEALERLQELRAELGFSLVEVDIETDDGLLARYLERIPVVALDGQELFDFFVDAGELRRRLRDG